MFSLCRALKLGLFFFFLFLGSLSCADAEQQTNVVRRAAFDIGSSVIKCTVADVDVINNTVVKVVERFSSKVEFTEDMCRSTEHELSQKIMRQGIATLMDMKRHALALNAVAFSAVGGAIFQKAVNGRAYFHNIALETGIRVRLISQQQASMLNFHSVRLEKKLPGKNVLVWDIGGSSQQMVIRAATQRLIFHSENLGAIPFKNSVISAIKGENSDEVLSPNPMTAKEVARALEYARTFASMNMCPEIVQRLKSDDIYVIGLGGVHYHAIPELVGGRQNVYTQEDIVKAIEKWTGKTDTEFDSEYAPTQLTNLILVLGYMQALDIKALLPLQVNLTGGLLVWHEFWQ